MPRRNRELEYLPLLSREIPTWCAAARSLIPFRHARRTLRYSSTV